MLLYLVLVVYYSCFVAFCALIFFFFKQKTAYEMRISDWSSDVCSSDLPSARRRAACPACAERRSTGHGCGPGGGSAGSRARRVRSPGSACSRHPVRRGEPLRFRWASARSSEYGRAHAGSTASCRRRAEEIGRAHV